MLYLLSPQPQDMHANRRIEKIIIALAVCMKESLKWYQKESKSCDEETVSGIS